MIFSWLKLLNTLANIAENMFRLMPYRGHTVWKFIQLTLCLCLCNADVAAEFSALSTNDNAQVNLSSVEIQHEDFLLWSVAAENFGRDVDFLVVDQTKAIDRELDWFKRNPNYIESVTRRSEPYAYHIVQQCIERGLPVELALVPFIESAYDAFAYSPGRATGLWQFVPATGKYFGLEQNWWYDGRRDAYMSTDAALTYLSRLHQRFDDWLLALAAYNAGPARVSRAIKKNRNAGLKTDYWSLSLPKETRHYVPRLLAIRDVLANSELYGMSPHPVPNMPHFQKVELDSQIDLAQAAKLAGIEMDVLYRLNPGFSRWATPPEGPHTLLLPVEAVASFTEALSKTNSADRLRWERYRVQKGDTLSGIARDFSSRHDLIAQANNLDSSRIIVGEILMVPIASEASSHYVLSADQRELALGNSKRGSEKNYYTVKPGDSWWKIGRKFDVSPQTLAKWNGKAAADLLMPGKRLVVWTKNTSSRDTISRSFTYTVKTGENLSLIASRYDVSIDQLRNWNDIETQKYLKPGQALTVRVAVAGSD